MKFGLLTAVLCFVTVNVFSQEHLPERMAQNYFDICRQMDEWFDTEYIPETDCVDDEWMKYQRWKYTWRDRVNPDGSFPDLMAQYSARNTAAGAERNIQPLWTFEGPDQVVEGGYWGMGRTKHVEFHPTNPDIFWVGTPDGGIWKTIDGGNSWAALGDGLPYLPVGIIRVDYEHPDTMYITLGGKSGWWEYGLGVYKSVDGGVNWFPTDLNTVLTDNMVIYSMEMDVHNPQILLAATNHGLYRTQNGGTNWAKIIDGEMIDFHYKPGSSDVAYAILHNYWGNDKVMKTVDGGDNWNAVYEVPVSENNTKLAMSIAAPEWVGMKWSNGKKFWLSKDEGASFNYVSDLPEDAIWVFSPTDTNVIYTAGVVVHRSLDQGAHWTQLTHWYNDGQHAEVHADAHDLVVNPYNHNEIYYCNDGGIYRYNEQTGVWTDHSNGLGIAQFYRVAVSETGPFRLAAGSQDNGGWLRKGNTNWIHTNGGDAMVQLIDPNNSGIMFTEYYGGNAIHRSTNSYFTNTTISDNLPDDPSGDWVTPFCMNPARPATMLFGFDNVYKTYDRGDHFIKLTTNLTGNVDNKLRDIRYAPNDTNIIVASWKSRMYRSTNGGDTWLMRLVPGNEDITRLAVHPANPDTIYACKAGYETGKKVFKSFNGGALWQNISGNMPNVPINCIIYDSLTNYLLVGTDIGVYYSNANTIDWQPFGIGLPNVWVLDLQIRKATRQLYVATHGRGVFSAPLDLISPTTEVGGQNRMQVFPNPARSTVYVSGGGANTGIWNSMGQQVLQSISTPGQLQKIDISRLPSGVYFLHSNQQVTKLMVSNKNE